MFSKKGWQQGPNITGPDVELENGTISMGKYDRIAGGRKNGHVLGMIKTKDNLFFRIIFDKNCGHGLIVLVDRRVILIINITLTSQTEFKELWE
jgi:hypothetical protein